jgi:hypothetical protein
LRACCWLPATWPKRSRTAKLLWPPVKKSFETDNPLTDVTADALAPLGRTEEAAALRERYGVAGDLSASA